MYYQKIKTVLKNKYFILSVITIVALFIRMLNINKPYGLWYDEMLTYIFSSRKFPISILQTIMQNDFHMPLYYLYLGAWMKLLGTSDIILRCSSVLWGTLTIPVFFYLGKTYKSEKLGYFLSLIGCLSPVMIYYSQELRFYSMLIFFAAYSLILFLKLVEAPNKQDAFLFGACNLIILYSYTMGIVFVFLEILLLFINYCLYNKNILSDFLKYTIIFFILSIPYFYFLFLFIDASNQAFVEPLSWGASNIFSPLILVNDLLSPFITGQFGQNTSIYYDFLKNPVMNFMLIIMSSASICFIIGFISSFRDLNKKFIYLSIILISFLLTETILYFSGDFSLNTRYLLIILPVILLISCNGILLIKTEFFKNTLISLILIIFIWNSLNYKNMPSFSLRQNGYKLPAQIIETKFGTGNNYIMYPNCSSALKKYLPENNFIDLDIPSILYLDKTKKEALKVFNQNLVLKINKHNSKEKLIPYLSDTKPSSELRKFIDNTVVKIPENYKLILIDDMDYRVNYKTIPEFMIKYKKNKALEDTYNTIFYYVLYDKIYGDLTSVLDTNKSLKKIQEFSTSGAGKRYKKWHFVIYQKI